MPHHAYQTVDVPTLIENPEFLPFYTTDGAAGADVHAHLTDSVIIPAHQAALIPTGMRMAIPDGYEIQVRPRSGLALKHLITVLNTPGTIDADYRGELKVILINHSQEPFTVTHGMRIAQLVLAPVVRANFAIVHEQALTETTRGTGGFGHTG